MPTRRDRAAEIATIRPAQPRPPLNAMARMSERRLAGALEVPIAQIEADPGQPRRDWMHGEGEERLAELAASIAEFGVLQPLIVREEGELGDGRQRFVVIAGGRRLAAARRAGLATVPVIVRGEGQSRVRLVQLVENVQRQDLSPLDEARAYQEMLDLEGLTPPLLAARLHVSAQHIRDRLRVLGDQTMADAVERGQVSASTARGILQLPDAQRATLRARVQRGDAIHADDVAAVRAELAARGVPNPRRKGERTKKQTVFVPDGEAPPQATEQTLFVPDSERHSQAAKQTVFVPPEEVAYGASLRADDDRRLSADECSHARAFGRWIAGTLRHDADAEMQSLLSRYVSHPAHIRWWVAVWDELRQSFASEA